MYFRQWQAVPASESTFPLETQLYFWNKILGFYFLFFSVLCHWQAGSLKSVFVLINVWVVGRKERLFNIMEWFGSLSCTTRRQHCCGKLPRGTGYKHSHGFRNVSIVRQHEELKRMVKGRTSIFSCNRRNYKTTNLYMHLKQAHMYCGNVMWNLQENLRN